jgi:serine/threonine protein phosphatase PrpC
VSSIIHKFFHKKSSGSSSLSNQEPDLEKSQGFVKEPNTIVEKESITRMPNNANLDLPQLIVGVAHSVGIERDHNEDALYTLTTNIVSDDKIVHFGLYIIADGMGGHENGEVASSVAVERLASHVVRSLYLPLISPTNHKMEASIQEIMQAGVIQAHQTIKKEALGGGTTLTSALILGNQMTIAHVGDSRAYMCNTDGNLHLLTHDHSLVKRLEDIGQISAEQALTHPQRNVLYRALGQGEPFEPDIATFEFQPGSQLMICSDGLWGLISDLEMGVIIRSASDPQHACQELTTKANSAGGPDNISVIIVRLPE